eukprot:3129153-Pyramimonas_sp.AAC.1
MGLASVLELLYLEPVLLHAGAVDDTNQIQHRQCLICPMAVTKAPLDSLQAAFVPVLVALGRPVVEQVRELHPAVVLVEGSDRWREPTHQKDGYDDAACDELLR